MAARIRIAGHEVPFAVNVVDGRHELTIGESTLIEGTNGCFVGGSHRQTNRLPDVIRGQMSSEDYVAELKRSVDVRFAVHKFRGLPAKETCERLARQARRYCRRRPWLWYETR